MQILSTLLVIITDNHHPYYMCFVRNKRNGAYFQAAQIYWSGRGTPKNSPIQSIFNRHLSLTKTDVLCKFHQNWFIFTRVIVRTNFESETTTPTATPTATTRYHAYIFFEFPKNFWFSARITVKLL